MHWLLVFLAFLIIGNWIGYVAIARDKKAARAGSRRRPEDTFSVLALLGWWPGMVLAMRSHRHKTRKASFKRQLALTALVGTGLAAIAGFGLWTMHP